jgi:hypothetical protein
MTSEENGTATTPVSESNNDKPAGMALSTRESENVEGDDGSDDQNNNDAPATGNSDLEEVEDGENIEIDLKRIADELQRVPKVEVCQMYQSLVLFTPLILVTTVVRRRRERDRTIPALSGRGVKEGKKQRLDI